MLFVFFSSPVDNQLTIPCKNSFPPILLFYSCFTERACFGETKIFRFQRKTEIEVKISFVSFMISNKYDDKNQTETR